MLLQLQISKHTGMNRCFAQETYEVGIYMETEPEVFIYVLVSPSLGTLELAWGPRCILF